MRPVKHDQSSYNSYLQIAERLVPYIKKMGYTHVEFMPVMEYPYDGSWGYQGTGFFAATSRFGKPEELMELIDQLHQNEIGVILDWVPSHFPGDAHGLFEFDGAHTYEYADMRKGYHPDWNSYIFNYARNEVVSFLLSSAHFWMDCFHADGLRVDAVNSIIRLDFSRKPGEWEPNRYGGNENVEAIDFLRKLNVSLYEKFEGIQTIAEEASDWPGITLSPEKGGFGFGMKWMMGWMHDSFRYFKRHPIDRPSHQNELSFSMMYFYDEHFMLPLSHDEVVHGKSPMIYKMPGDEWQKYANLRLLYAYMMTHPGAKLNFMGNEFGQTSEWNYTSELNWELLQFEPHSKLQTLVIDLNHLYKSYPALYQYQFHPKGFQWESLDHPSDGILVFRRMGKKKAEDVLVIMNIGLQSYEDRNFCIKGRKQWRELLNTNDKRYWGSGWYMNENIRAEVLDKKKAIYEIKLHIPALSVVILG
jgi:1,4-alpha-glucan branching enzyme